MKGADDTDCRLGVIATWGISPVAMTLAASTALLGQSLAAQESNSNPPAAANSNPPASSERASKPVVTDSTAGLRLGPFDVQPRVVTGVTYDDNILISSHNPESDFIWSMQPAFLAVAGDRTALEEYQRSYHEVVGFSPSTFIVQNPEEWPDKTFMVDYGPRFNWFTEHPENNCIDQFLNANAIWPLGKTMLGFRQGYVLQNTTIIEAGKRTWQQIIPTVLMGGYQFSEKTSAEVNLSRMSMSYQENEGLADYTDWNWENWLNYQYSSQLNLSLGLNLGYLDLPSQPDQTYQTPLFRARYHYGPRIIVDGSVGVQLREYGGGVEDTIEPVFKLTAYYQARESTSISLNLFRNELPSVGFGYDYIQTGVSLGVWQALNDRYFVTVSCGYYHADYVATVQSEGNAQSNRTENYVALTPGLEVRLTKHLVGNVFYQFRNLESRQWDGWSDNQAGVRLTWTF